MKEITKIKIKLSDTEIELTATEARKIYEELAKLFNLEEETLKELKELKKIIEEKNIQEKNTPYFPYYPPIIIREPTPVEPWRPSWDVWCSSEGNGLNIVIK